MTLLSLDAPNQVSGASVEPPNQRSEANLRRVAEEFEALLLTQLTASLNPKEDDEGDGGVFSNGGGMGLSKQMFSEQVASTMAKNGGIGLADFIMTQFSRNSGSAKPAGDRALAAAREIRESVTSTRSASYLPSKTVSSDTQATISKSAVSVNSDRVDPGAVASVDVSRMTRPRRVHPLKLESESIAPPASAPVPNSAKTSALRTATKPVAFSSPVQGPLRSVFGPRRDPINGRPRFHEGIDIAVPMGTPVAAAAAGKVVFAGRNKGYGNMVMLEHADGRRTLYGHAQKLMVKAGDLVQKGQTIAAAGSTGHSKGPHVHFEVRENNKAVDPLKFLTNAFPPKRR